MNKYWLALTCAQVTFPQLAVAMYFTTVALKVLVPFLMETLGANKKQLPDPAQLVTGFISNMAISFASSFSFFGAVSLTSCSGA